MRLKWPPRQPVSPICCITMVKDEEPFLNAWFSHYIREFKNVAFMIIDHASKRPVKDFVAQEWASVHVDVIELPNFPFDAEYKANALSALAGIALGAYELVIPTDADEIIIPLRPLGQGETLYSLLEDDLSPFIAPIGMEFIHNSNSEGGFDFNRPLLDQRDFFRFHSGYTKPAIWRGQDAAFGAGQHRMDKPFVYSSTLALAHLKYVDESYSRDRQAHRNSVELSDAHLAKGRGANWTAQASDDWGGVYKRVKAGKVSADSKDVYTKFREQLLTPVPGTSTHSLKISSDVARYSDL